MKLAIYDTAVIGHHAPYLKAIASAGLERDWRVTVVLPQANCEPQLVEDLRSALGEKAILLSPFPAPYLRRSTSFDLLRHHVSIHRCAERSLSPLENDLDFVFFPTLDSIDKAIQLFGNPTSVPMGGMCMRARFHMRKMGIVDNASELSAVFGQLAFRRLLRTRGVRCITTADPALASFAQKQTTGEYRKVRYVPEIGMDHPRMNPSQARARWGFNAEDRVLLVYGALSLRKGVREVLNLIAASSDSRIRALIVGESDAECKGLLAGDEFRSLLASGRVKVYDAYADALTEDAAFACADAVWVAYSNHSTMSGVFLQAVCAGVPVVTANYGVLRWLASHYGVGVCINPFDSVASCAQVAQLLFDDRQIALFRRNAQRLAEQHRPANFGRAVCDAIANSLHRAEFPSLAPIAKPEPGLNG